MSEPNVSSVLTEVPDSCSCEESLPFRCIWSRSRESPDEAGTESSVIWVLEELESSIEGVGIDLPEVTVSGFANGSLIVGEPYIESHGEDSHELGIDNCPFVGVSGRSVLPGLVSSEEGPLMFVWPSMTEGISSLQSSCSIELSFWTRGWLVVSSTRGRRCCVGSSSSSLSPVPSPSSKSTRTPSFDFVSPSAQFLLEYARLKKTVSEPRFRWPPVFVDVLGEQVTFSFRSGVDGRILAGEFRGSKRLSTLGRGLLAVAGVADIVSVENR